MCWRGWFIYQKDTIKFSINQCSKICLPNAEHLWVDIQTKRGPIATGVVYRHPDNSATTINKFNLEMNELFLMLNMSKRPFYCLGDININLLKISKNDAIRRYAGMLISCNCRCLIDVPTRSCASTSTLIDHIYTNDKMNPTASGVLTNSDLSDHYGIFTIISEGIDKKTSSKQNYVLRDMSNFKTEEFLDHLHIKLGNLFENNCYSANKLFGNFVSIFTEVVDLFAPQRNATRKEKKLKLKPWLTPALLKSIQTKNKMFKRLHKNSDNLVLTEKYKAYRNALNRLLRLAKRNYYLSVLNEHKGNSRKVWQVVNELAFTKNRTRLLPSKLVTSNGHTFTDEETIAEAFNSYFVNIGKSMADAISPGSACNFNFSATNKNSNLLFLTPSCPQEFFNVIKKLKTKKARRTNDVETVFIKYANPVISKFLSDMFNVCLSEGTYPDLLKIAEVVPIFKKGERNKMTNYRPISLLSQFNKAFEKLLYTRIYSYLTKFNLLSDNQFWFRKELLPNASY